MSGDIIEVLPVSLSLVRIPRSRVSGLFHPILSQILRPDPTFLNVTCNELELSMFAADSVVDDFAPVARRDRRRLDKRPAFEPVEISSDKWKVIQIPSPDSSGARVHELSAPIAAAGISILYQSSHQSDFIFVKENHLYQVLNLLHGVGFTPTDTDGTPLSPNADDAVYDPYADLAPGSGAVLTRTHSASVSPAARTRSNTGSSLSLAAALTRRIECSLGMSPLRPPEPAAHDADAAHEPASEPAPAPAPARPRTHSAASYAPAPTDVRILAPDLTCVGLPNEAAEAWALKIVRLVAFPATIVPAREQRARARELELDSPFHDFEARRPSGGPASAGARSRSSSSSCSSSCSSESESASDRAADGALPLSTPSMPPAPFPAPACSRCRSRFAPDLHSCSCPDLSSAQPGARPASPGSTCLPSDSPRPPAPADAPAKPARPRLAHTDTITAPTPFPAAAAAAGGADPAPDGRARAAVPFFSFTRAPESSSLSTSVALLAALFPPAERHMLTCGDALDEFDAAPPARVLSRGRARGARADATEEAAEGDADADADARAAGALKRCLQIDLRRFGLDKHGLVNRFSRVLEEHGIDHMYSSTYKTANMLVARRDAKRARALLSLC